MIIRLTGGLGNQLFQYAFGREQSAMRNEPLLYDDFSYLRDKKRNNEIDSFDLKMKRISTVDMLKYNFHFYLHEKLGINSNLLFFEDTPYAFIEDLKDEQCKYYCGCWINSKYFSSIKEELDKSFWPTDISERIIEEGKRIESVNSVMLHVRRGDYLSIAGYVVLGTEYFTRALDCVFDNVSNPVFCVFSDDIEWCKNELPKCFPEKKSQLKIQYFEGNSTTEDFYLMRKCKHFIISNSTFSWWPAYLGNVDDDHSIKIAPNNWFDSSMINKRISKGLLEGFYTL